MQRIMNAECIWRLQHSKVQCQTFSQKRKFRPTVPFKKKMCPNAFGKQMQQTCRIVFLGGDGGRSHHHHFAEGGQHIPGQPESAKLDRDQQHTWPSLEFLRSSGGDVMRVRGWEGKRGGVGERHFYVWNSFLCGEGEYVEIRKLLVNGVTLFGCKHAKSTVKMEQLKWISCSIFRERFFYSKTFLFILQLVSRAEINFQQNLLNY